MTRLRLRTVVAAVVALTAAACSSSRRAPIPYPTDPDKDATYCLRYLPPTYREVPQLVQCKPPRVCDECTWRKEVSFREVCTPGSYEAKCTPCRTRKTVELVAEPGRTEWVQAPCAGEKGGCCWKPCDIPPKTRCCEVTETENGVAYCAFTPPTYDVVAQTRVCRVKTPVYKPGEYDVRWCKEEFMPGRWVWVKRTDCCPPPCGTPRSAPRTGDFNYAPPAD